MTGQYVFHDTVGEKEKAIFDYAMRKNVGVDFKPLAVASQIVSGVQYLFICTGKEVALGAVTKLYIVEIFAKFQHSVAPQLEVTSIDELPIEKILN